MAIVRVGLSKRAQARSPLPTSPSPPTTTRHSLLFYDSTCEIKYAQTNELSYTVLFRLPLLEMGRPVFATLSGGDESGDQEESPSDDRLNLLSCPIIHFSNISGVITPPPSKEPHSRRLTAFIRSKCRIASFDIERFGSLYLPRSEMISSMAKFSV